ncbi:helix-turn-helix transcriptional regulator [Micromonospora sp. NPDC006766]|uniref:helix-turn-helix domain-containing protein n=1 Tax=Micromonospora sp. NPDC006766 TaxID=3154778 RepID=UPI0033CF6393
MTGIPKPTTETISDAVVGRIRKHRRAADMTRAQLAQRCAALGSPDITEAALANIETGRRDADGQRRRDLTVDELIVLADALEVDPSQLLFGTTPLKTVDDHHSPTTPDDRYKAGDRWLEQAIDAFAAGSDPRAAAAAQIATAYFTSAEAWIHEPRRAGKPASLPVTTNPAAVTATPRPKRRRRTTTPELLKEAARVYRQAVERGHPPTVAVAEHFNLSHRSAGRWVSQAREAGDLGPAHSTRAGEVTA